MIKVLLLSFLIFIFADAKGIDAEIKNANSKIHSTKKDYSEINAKMAKNAQDILEQKKEIDKQQKLLLVLIEDLKEKEKTFGANSKKLVKLENGKKELQKNRNKLEQDLVFTIAQSVSLSVILEEDYVSSADSLIEFEVLKLMLKNSKDMVKKLHSEFYENNKKIDLVSVNINSLQKSIESITSKRKKLLNIQDKNKIALKQLEKSKSIYKKSLKKILVKQDALKNTLAKLNIIKIDQIQKDAQDAERKKAFNSKSMINDKNLPTVKLRGSSYQNIKTRKYRGKKTIAPFTPYTITKKYGKYKDPIYGIKVFNESISLKPKKKNTKVKTVFNGKVIYADKTAVLDNIVIVQHSGGLHTIYANLSQISPNIKKGKKIKKGYTIGRVSDELVFEVTQKSYHINPVRLFQ